MQDRSSVLETLNLTRQDERDALWRYIRRLNRRSGGQWEPLRVYETRPLRTNGRQRGSVYSCEVYLRAVIADLNVNQSRRLYWLRGRWQWDGQRTTRRVERQRRLLDC